MRVRISVVAIAAILAAVGCKPKPCTKCPNVAGSYDEKRTVAESSCGLSWRGGGGRAIVKQEGNKLTLSTDSFSEISGTLYDNSAVYFEGTTAIRVVDGEAPVGFTSGQVTLRGQFKLGQKEIFSGVYGLSTKQCGLSAPTKWTADNEEPIDAGPADAGPVDGGVDAGLCVITGSPTFVIDRQYTLDGGVAPFDGGTPVVTTLAGNGGFLDGTGGMARFNRPEGLVVEPSGMLLVADSDNHRLREIDATGKVTTFAGDGYSGLVNGMTHGTPPAEFNYPTGIAMDSAGRIYVSEPPNKAIRRIDIDGTVTTFAEVSDPGGIAFDLAGNLIVTRTKTNTIDRISPAGVVTRLAGVDGSNYEQDGAHPAFNVPYSVAVDRAGQIYVGDLHAGTIRIVAADGSATTLAHLPGLGLSPNGLAVDSQGRVYATVGYSIVVVSPNGSMRTFAGTGQSGLVDGPALAAKFVSPSALAFGADGSLFVADGCCIRKIDTSARVTTIAGSLGSFADGTGGRFGTAVFNVPKGIASDTQGVLFVADSENHSIRRVDLQGNVTTLAGNGTPGFEDGVGPVARFLNPTDVAVDANGNVLVADTGNASIRLITPGGDVSTLAGNGTTGTLDGSGGRSGTARFDSPRAVAVGPDGVVYVGQNDAIRAIDGNGNVTTRIRDRIRTGITGSCGNTTSLRLPVAISVDQDGTLYYVDELYNAICSLDTCGRMTTVVPPLFGINDIVPLTPGYFLVSLSNEVDWVDQWGNKGIFAGRLFGNRDGTGGPNGEAQFGNPAGLALAPSGVYVADQSSGNIRFLKLPGL